MVFEDAHWSDPSSRELLDLTINRIQRLPVLLILTFRPEFQPAWTGQSHVTTLVLNRLQRRDGEALVKQMLGNRALPDEIVKEIVERTDGVPLFVEELTKSVLETGLGAKDAHKTLALTPSPALAVPVTLHAPLMARLDGLGAAKDIAQFGSAIGREFSFDLLSAVAERPSGELEAGLARLVAAGLIFQRGTPPQATYLFKHALIQDAAYSTLLREPRQRLHARIAEALREQSPETTVEHPEVLAQHYAKAGLADQAAAMWLAAGERAISRSATVEAIAHFSDGLTAIAQLAEGRKKQELELNFRLNLAGALVAAKGPAAAEIQQQFTRARELGHQLGDQAGLFWARFGQWCAANARAQHDAALTVAGELIGIAEHDEDKLTKSVAHACMGTTACQQGKFTLARRHLERSLDFDDPRQVKTAIKFVGWDVKIQVLKHLSRALAILGYGIQGRLRAEQAIERGDLFAHGKSRTFAQSAALEVGWVQLDYARIREATSVLLKQATEYDLPFLKSVGRFWAAWLKAQSGNIAEGTIGMREEIIAHQNLGVITSTPRQTAMLADSLRNAGNIQEGIGLIDQALSLVEATSEVDNKAEFLRLKGELLLALNPPNIEEAQANFLSAIELARHQSAKTWELRAATSLARLWCDNGRPAEARDLLSPVYNWFTEGFDFPDLTDARALLDELAQRRA